MPETQEVGTPEIQKERDLKVLQEQARVNTLALTRLASRIDTITPGQYRRELEEEKEKLLQQDPTPEYTQRLQEIEISLEKLTQGEEAEVMGKVYEHLREQVTRRQARSGVLLRRRNAVLKEETKAKEEKEKEVFQEATKLLWGETLDKDRREYITRTEEFLQKTKSIRSRLEPEDGFKRTLLDGLIRNLQGCLDLMRRVPRFYTPPNE